MCPADAHFEGDRKSKPEICGVFFIEFARYFQKSQLTFMKTC